LSNTRHAAARPRVAWWFPLAIVIVTLVSLGVLPALVAHRVSAMRRHIDSVLEPARRAATDMQRTVVAGVLPIGGQPIAAPTAETHAQVTHDLSILDSLIPDVGPAPRAQWEKVRDAIARWAGATSPFTCAPILTKGLLTGLRCQSPATQAVRATTDLGNALDVEAETERLRSRRIERWDVLMPILLVPLALLAVVLVGSSALRVRRLAMETALARDALAAAAVERARLLRGATHDLRNPLGAALSYSQLLADGIPDPLTGAQADLVTRLSRQLQMSLDGMTSLLDWSLTGEVAAPADASLVDLSSTLRQIAGDREADAQRAGLRLHVDAGDSACEVWTDGQSFHRIVDNLISNAIKFTPRGGHVTVRLERRGDVAIVIEDTGPGIPASARERIFSEFTRLAATSGPPGFGIGLATSRRLARALGGDISVADRPGGGSIFTLILPPRAYSGVCPATC
jgi:signal transduction histidine kinase